MVELSVCPVPMGTHQRSPAECQSAVGPTPSGTQVCPVLAVGEVAVWGGRDFLLGRHLQADGLEDVL